MPTDKSLADIHSRLSGNRKRFNARFVLPNEVPSTIAAGEDSVPIRHDHACRIADIDLKCIGSYPQDYDFGSLTPGYLIGMSVPPVMTAQVAHQVNLQWLSR